MSAYTDEDTMPFGKHVGKLMRKVPASYLIWLADQPNFKEKWSDLSAYIESNRKVLEKEAEKANLEWTRNRCDNEQSVEY